MQSGKWVLGYWEDNSGKRSIEQWLLALPKEQAKSVSKELKLLEMSGCKLRLPHSKALGKGLFELRERNYNYRIYYGFNAGQIIVLLHSGNKSTQQHDIKVARERLLQVREIKGLVL